MIASSARPAVAITDAGTAYVKALGGQEGPHTLACELVGTRCARWLGLPTLDFAVIELGADDCSLWPAGENAQPGPAYATRGVQGTAWGGSDAGLRVIENARDVSGLVVLDTWTLNCDRYSLRGGGKPRVNLRNVFMTSEDAGPGKLRLLAMDHTHCFSCGRDLSEKRLQGIDSVQSEEVYGLFPEFVPLVTRENVAPFVDRLGAFDHHVAAEMTSGVPMDWGWSLEIQRAIGTFLERRAEFLARRIEALLAEACEWNPVLKYGDAEND